MRIAIAGAVLRAATSLLPAQHRFWGEAMRREMAEIAEPGAALEFACGCAWTCLEERMLIMETIVKTGGWIAALAMLALAAAGAVSADRLGDAHAGVATVFGLLAACFAMAALWSLLRGPQALIQIASTMLAVNGLALLFLYGEDAAAWQPQPIFRALAVEGLFIWSAMLAGGLLLAWAPRSAWLQARLSR